MKSGMSIVQRNEDGSFQSHPEMDQQTSEALEYKFARMFMRDLFKWVKEGMPDMD